MTIITWSSSIMHHFLRHAPAAIGPCYAAFPDQAVISERWQSAVGSASPECRARQLCGATAPAPTLAVTCTLSSLLTLNLDLRPNLCAGAATSAPHLQAVDANSRSTVVAAAGVPAPIVTARAERAHRNLIRRAIADW